MEIFQNDSQALQIGALTIENQPDSVVISGDVEIGKTASGKEQAQALYDFAKNLLDTLSQLEKDGGLLAELPKADDADTVENPFA